IYLYYQKQNTLANFTGSTGNLEEIEEVKKVNQIFANFCKNEIGGQDINEIRTKLNGRTLTEILEENDDYETTVDELKRKKGELEAEITSLTTASKNRVGEKERIITRITQEKKELETKYKNKSQKLDGEQCENNKLTEQITSLGQQITELKTEIQQDKQEYQTHLNMNNLLFAALLIALLYYFLVYLPAQKKLTANLPLQHNQQTQTEPLTDEKALEIAELKSKIKQLKQDYRSEMQTKREQITKLQSEIRDLAKRPAKPTNSKTTQTDSEKEGVYSELSQTDLTKTLDTLIKDIQALNNEL
ncbi:9996_t:CDS:2, partial [Funneliformis geosporum]